MREGQRSDFVRRLSTMGLGTRESMHVMLGSIVYDIRAQAVQKRYNDEEMDAVVQFHDQAEALWRDTISTDPPLDPEQMVIRLKKLVDLCSGPLEQFLSKLERGARNAEEFAAKK